DIISLAGLEGSAIGETLADPASPVALPGIKVEEPTVRMAFGVNTSPFTGREGTWGTSRKLRERLFNELRSNLSLRVGARDSVQMPFIVPTRAMLGFRYQFLTATRGMGVMNTLFHGYLPMVGGIRS